MEIRLVDMLLRTIKYMSNICWWTYLNNNFLQVYKIVNYYKMAAKSSDSLRQSSSISSDIIRLPINYNPNLMTKGYSEVLQDEGAEVRARCSWGKYKSTATCGEQCCPCRADAPLFWIINWVAALLHLVNTVATLGLWAASDEQNQTFALSETYAPWINITGQDGCPESTNATRIFQISEDWCIERRTEYTSDLSLWWLVIAFHFLSFAFQTFAMIQWRCKCCGILCERDYTKEVDQDGTNILRMLEYSISATLMQIAIALVLGIWQRLVIAGVAALTVVTMLCGLIAEQLKYDRKDMAWVAHFTGWLSMGSVWAILGRQFWYTVEMSAESPPDFVYVIIIVIAILYIGFGVIQVVQLAKSGPEPDVGLNRGVELAYCVNSLTSKTFLGWIIFANALAGMAQS